MTIAILGECSLVLLATCHAQSGPRYGAPGLGTATAFVSAECVEDPDVLRSTSRGCPRERAALAEPRNEPAESNVSNQLLCTSTLRVNDTQPPGVLGHDVLLSASDHRMRTVSVSDCGFVQDSCDTRPVVRFAWATSDEGPASNAEGAPLEAIVFRGCQTVELRAEADLGGNGRVYELGWIARDRAGNRTEGVCRVAVPREAAVAIADHPVVRVDAPAACPGGDDATGGRGSSDGDLDGLPSLPHLHTAARACPPGRAGSPMCGGQLPTVVVVDLFVDLGVGVDVDFDPILTTPLQPHLFFAGSACARRHNG